MEKPIVHGFFRSVLSYPKNNALWINNCYYSYEQFSQIVISIYKNIPTDKIYERIGIYSNDDVYTYAGILAINLYGAAYVPLNNKFPIARNKSIAKQCELKLILSSVDDENLKEISKETNIVIIGDTSAALNKSQEISKEIDSFHKTQQPVSYILFTSGSTGEPKGVPVSHSNINHFFDFFLKNYAFNQNDKFLQVYELTFDVSVFSFFMPMLVGACSYVVPNDEIKFIKIVRLLKEQEITVVSMVPGILHYIEKYLNEIQFDKLRYSFFSGDALYHNLAVKWKQSMPNGQIHNFYGPTETTIVCTCYPWNEIQSGKESVNGIVPLGKPFSGLHALIIDENNQAAEKGELCFTGSQVISNYLDLNQDNFFDHRGKRYYKTGDIASYNTMGNLIFHGRTDNQVKISGYRVELGEIEFMIEKITTTKCTVLCTKDEKQMNTLIAFIETKHLNQGDLKRSLSMFLPDYMIPKQFVAIENFPLNLNGKIDKNKLLNLQE
ncbi:MAG: AMP-binding protein [Bacteroidetes bacterium]|nr:AMP-binding protein [Bacteroidota bacterium]